MPDIGATLREARMRARIDITEVETKTKIRAKYLRAIENEEWDLLPGEVYVKSFLRTYSDYLGLDSRLLIDDFKRRYERPSDNELRPLTPLGRDRDRDRGRRGPLLPPWAVIGLVLLVVVVALYFVGTFVGNSTKTTPVTTVTHPRASHRPSRGTHHHPVTIPVKPKTVKLQLTPTGQVYVCVVDGTGKKLIPGLIFTAGQTIPTETAPKLLLTLGNAAVKMKVNGASVAVPASPTSIGFLLQPSGTSSLPVARQPRCT
jgi:cytoskeleton protein RodZ